MDVWQGRKEGMEGGGREGGREGHTLTLCCEDGKGNYMDTLFLLSFPRSSCFLFYIIGLQQLVYSTLGSQAHGRRRKKKEEKKKKKFRPTPGRSPLETSRI